MLRYLDGRHADSIYEADLKALVDALEGMRLRVSAQYDLLAEIVSGTFTQSGSKAKSKEIDKEINALQSVIDARVHAIIARNAPQLSELRFVLAASKLAGQYERMGDHCKNIIKRLTRSFEQFTPTVQAQLRDMVVLQLPFFSALEEVSLRFSESAAKAICDADDAIDRAYKACVGEVTRAIREQTLADDKVADAMFIAKNLERLADHATVIAREYMYIHSGQRRTDW